MTLDAILVCIPMPYTIELEHKDNCLSVLHQKLSNSSEPILPLDLVIKLFNVNDYEIFTYCYELWKILDDEPAHFKIISERENVRLSKLNGKKYIKLKSNDIKNLFSTEIFRNKQLNKILL